MQGMIYIDATSTSSVPEEIGKAAGIVFTQPTLIEVLRYKTSTFNREPVLFELPKESLAKQIDYIMKVLESTCHAVFKKVPVLLIDSADALAKRDEEAFACLLAHCKSLANKHVIGVLLVSSEGHVIPKLNQLSERSRCAPVFHVPDIINNKAEEFLRNYSYSDSLAEKIAFLCGGRWVNHDDDKVFKSVDTHLHSCQIFCSANRDIIIRERDYCRPRPISRVTPTGQSLLVGVATHRAVPIKGLCTPTAFYSNFLRF